jgi:hypothetical protein
LSETFLILRIQRDVTPSVCRPSCKMASIFCLIFLTLELSRQILEISSFRIHKQIRQMGAELFHECKRTDRHEADIVAFRSFVKVPKSRVTNTLYSENVILTSMYTWLAPPLIFMLVLAVTPQLVSRCRKILSLRL